MDGRGLLYVFVWLKWVAFRGENCIISVRLLQHPWVVLRG